MSVVLCSLLIGAGYDAYCVCGYATREITLMDETRNICPLLKLEDQVAKKVEKKEVKKYAVKPPKDLASKYEAKLAGKEKEEEEAKEMKRKEEEAAKIAVIFHLTSSFIIRDFLFKQMSMHSVKFLNPA